MPLHPTVPKRMGRPPKDPTQPPAAPTARVGTRRPGAPSKPKGYTAPQPAKNRHKLSRTNLENMLARWANDTLDLDSRNPVNDLRRTLAIALAYMGLPAHDGSNPDPESTRSYALVAVAAIRGLSDIRVEEIDTDRQLAMHFNDRSRAHALLFAPAAYDAVVETNTTPQDDFIPADIDP